ncbi:transposase, IS605 OrfB family protein [Natrinema pellirubrum DSM 15624]|uniref:Transposase n=1 Tax=Natrinema pellirubrum (strain DSM 15624 / CIP 106293 / JCM 10476 / NCIMB 786 / 157) TaxID=797303 RepID=L0JF85_NATP1|nr:IS200/IS605 family transposon protein TnpB [Natrinema pellirubrum]AGB30195.1 transposase [Natrinema pellirubrum DSM 15624]ELY78478.1 transposase, IS605 OrfB family protein [Natrinema pellirubrum DSM 15624]
MRRVNTFEIRPLSERDEILLFEILDASASLWNELTYRRRQAFYAGEDIWQGDTGRYRSKYKGTIGAAAVQQVIRRNDEAWRGFFGLLEEGSDANPPGYWKDDEQRKLRTLVRNDQYTLEWGKRSRLEIPVGLDLKEKYGLGYNERLRLEARGDPRWTGKGGRLGLVYDRDTDSFRARQPVENATRRRRESLATVSSDDDAVAALDIGANNLVAVTTTRGDQLLYHGRPQFHRFRRTTERIATLQSRLGPEKWTSRRIRRHYQQRSDRRNHLQDALIRDLREWLRDRNVSSVIVGDLGAFSSHWCARVNEKVHLFWAYGRFQRRLREVLQGEYGIDVREVDESGSSSQCPRCGGQNINRCKDTFQCRECGFEGHSDVVGSENLLFEHTDCGSMARPAAPDQNRSGEGHREVPRLEWDDHRWQRRDRSTKENPVNRSTWNGKFAAGESGTA